MNVLARKPEHACFFHPDADLRFVRKDDCFRAMQHVLYIRNKRIDTQGQDVRASVPEALSSVNMIVACC